MKLYVGNLPYSVTEEDIRELFSQVGKVASIDLIKDRMSGESKGFAFVEMDTNSEADKAIKSLNGSNYNGRLIKVNQAQNKQSRGRAPSGRRF